MVLRRWSATTDKAGAIGRWIRGACVPAYRTVLEQAAPDAFEQAVADADSFFAQELCALRWPKRPAKLSSVTRRVLPGHRP